MKRMIAAGCLAAAMSASAPVPGIASPQSTPVHRITVDGAEGGAEALERTFWICDYVAQHARDAVRVPGSVRGDYRPGSRPRNSRRDYEEMVEWWRERKPAEHLKLEAGREPLTPRVLVRLNARRLDDLGVVVDFVADETREPLRGMSMISLLDRTVSRARRDPRALCACRPRSWRRRPSACPPVPTGRSTAVRPRLSRRPRRLSGRGAAG
jgi:hypothetical protein